MGLQYSPKIITSGLVLYLDTLNSKSYKGEPTVNYVNTPLDWVNWAITANVVRAEEYLTREGYSGKILQFNADGAASTVYAYQIIPVVGIATVTFSFWARKISGSGTTLVLDPDGYRTGGVRQSPDVTPATYNFTIDSEWKKYSTTINTNDALGQSIYMYFYHSSYRTINYEIALPQLELKSHATQFVNGTRGTTVATGGGLADLSGNNYHASFYSAAQFQNQRPYYPPDSANGQVGTQISSTASSDLNLGTGDISVEVWFKQLSGSVLSSHGLFTHGANGGGPGYGMYLSATGLMKGEVYGTTGGRQQFSLGASATPGQYNQVVYIFSVPDLKVYGYLNGVYTGQFSFLATGAVNSAYTWAHFGTSHGDYYRGLYGFIDILRVYKRQLSAVEIADNYNAMKGRFGL
jgi:hypothetical protein